METATNLKSLLLGAVIKSGTSKPDLLKQDWISRRSGKRATLVDSRIQALRILAQTMVLVVDSLGEPQDKGKPSSLDVKSEVRRFEIELIRSALIKTGGRQRPAARILGMKVTTLNSKIKRYGITIDEADVYVPSDSAT